MAQHDESKSLRLSDLISISSYFPLTATFSLTLGQQERLLTSASLASFSLTLDLQEMLLTSTSLSSFSLP